MTTPAAVPLAVPDTIETVPLGRLKLYPDNPRLGDVAGIKESIVRNGFHGALSVARWRP